MSIIILLLVVAVICNHYFFGMQRVLLQAGRYYDMDFMFLLPKWFFLSKVLSLLKLVLVVLLLTHSILGGIVAFVMSVILASFIPIHSSWYIGLFEKNLKDLDIDRKLQSDILNMITSKGWVK